MPNFYIGIDISKLTLDVAVLEDRTLLLTDKIANSEAGIKKLLTTLQSNHDSTPDNTIYCAEHMGIYGKFLQDVLHKKKARLCLESPLRIKMSLGIQRSKSDKIDAINIAKYARKNIHSLKFWAPPRPVIGKLKTLMSIRKKLIKMGGMLKNAKKIQSYFLSDTGLQEMRSYTNATAEAIQADIDSIENKMVSLIERDKTLKHLMQIVTSIPFIGKVVATEIIIATNEFKDFTSPKKFCSYCGIAPFSRTSGTSLKGKPKVSPMANKELKKVLHLAALGSTRPVPSPFKAYYMRKVREGKNKMSVLNAIRNKLVRVIFACVRDNKVYEEPA